MMVDTLTIARELKAADLPPGQAEAIAAAIGRSVGETTATKVDLDLLRQELKADMAMVRSDLDGTRHELRADPERLHSKLLLWFIGTQVAIGGFIVALVKL